MKRTVFVGTAGWSIATRDGAAFPGGGSHLERYARRFDAVEINSSFHRPHRRTTYERWAASVPEHFRFSVKVPRTITHEQRLVDCEALLSRFIDECEGLGDRLGALLVQLPPSLALDPDVTARFFGDLGGRTEAALLCEPRHASWFTDAADELLRRLRVARVAADPAPLGQAGSPGGSPDICYLRLHGSPVIYRSSYDDAALRRYAAMIASAPADRPAWCIFDNTAGMAATGDALRLAAMLA